MGAGTRVSRCGPSRSAAGGSVQPLRDGSMASSTRP